MKKKDTLGYSQKSLAMLGKGTYGKTTGRQAKYTTSQEQTRQAKELPMLKEMRKTTSAAPNKATEMVNNPVQNKQQKPSTRYNQNVNTQEQKSTRDTRYDKDFDTFHTYRYEKADMLDDYKEGQEARPYWQKVKEDIKAKNKWSEEQFNEKWEAYNKERNQQAADKEVQTMADLAKEHPLFGTIAQQAYMPQTLIEGAAAMLSNLGSEKNKAQSANDPLFTGTRAREAAKQAVKDEHIKTRLGKGAYDLLTSVADMAESAAIPILGTASLGTQAAARQNMQALERGVDPNKAALTGAASGVISGLMNKVGLDKALGAAGKTALGTVGKAAVREGLENVVEDVANYGVDAAINRNKSQLNTLHDYYVGEGMSDDDAWSQVIKDTGLDLTTSALSGAAFGGVMSGMRNIPALTKELKGIDNKLDNKGGVDIPELQKAKAEFDAENAQREAEAAKIFEGMQSKKPLEGDALTEAKAKQKDVSQQLVAKNKEIQAQQEVLNNAPKKNKRVEKAKLDALKKEAADLQAQKKSIARDIKGEATPIKEQLSKDDYDSIYSERTGLKSAINLASKFAGDTPEAKQLSKDLKQAIDKYVESGNPEDYFTVAEMATALHNLANSTRAEYKTKTGNVYNFNDIFGTEDLIDMTIGSRVLTKKVPELHRSLQPEEGFNDGQLTPQEIQRLQEGLAEDEANYPGEYSAMDSDGKGISNEIVKQFADSKMRDDNNNLMVMYHGTNADFTGFDTSKSKDKSSVFFTNNPDVAQSYTGTDKIHKAYLNVKNPLVIDANGRSGVNIEWTPEESGKMGELLRIINEFEKKERNGERVTSEEVKAYDKAQAEYDELENKINSYGDISNTDGIAAYAKDHGYDGVIIKNVLDVGSETDKAIPSTVAIVSDPSNIKEIETNTQAEVPKNEIPTVKPTEPTPARSLPELVQNNSIIQRMMAQGGGNGGNVPPAEADYSMGNRRHTKTSETYTNTGRYGKGWTEEEYNKYTDPSQFQYEDVSEQESVERAANMLQSEGLEGFKKRVMNKERLTGAEIDGLMMEWRILGDQARTMEAAGEDASDAWKESVKVFRKIQEQSTSNAQALQVLAKWSRNTPEGMLADAENIINGKKKAKGPDKSDIQKEFEKFAKKNKKFKFSDDFAVEFQRKAAELEGLDRDSRRAKELMAELGKMVNRQVPSSIGEKAMTFLMDNMLGNFRTLITRNAGGNLGLNAVEQIAERPLAALIDKGVAKKTGRRTQAGLSKEGLLQYFNGFTQGLKEEAADFAKDLHTSRTGENTLSNAIHSNRHVFKEKGIPDKLDKLVRHGLSIGDRPFYEAVYNQTIGDYNRLRDQGLMGDVVQGLSDEDFNSYAETAAKLNALSAVYQQDSLMSKALLGFKGAVGDLSEAALGFDILSQFSMPFVKTPANVVERAIDYSPLGFVRNAVRTGKEIKGSAFDQNRFANETARNILGTALITGGAIAKAKGGLSGAYSEDKDEKQAQKEAGEQEYAWNVPNWIPGLGGKQMDISWAPVVGSNMVAAAAAQDAYDKGEDGLAMNLAKGLEAGGQALFDQSMFQGLQRLFGTGEAYNSDEGIVANMGNVVKSGLSQFIPSLVRQSAQVKDPYQRDIAYSNKELSFGPMDNYDINSLVNSVPELRENVLAPKVNTSGELMKENQGRNLGMKILEDMILPGKLTEVQYSRLSEEAKRLSDATGTKDSYMPKADRKAVDELHVLNNQEWTEYQQKYYGNLTKAGEMLIDSDYYKSASPSEQEKMLSTVYSALKSGINHEYTGKDVDGAAKKYVEAGGGDDGIDAVMSYIQSKNAVDSAGISSSTKAAKEITQAYEDGDIEKGQKLAAQARKDDAERKRLNEKYGTDIKLAAYQEREAKEPGSNEKWAKEHAKTVPEVKVNSDNIDTKDHEKFISRAGAQAQKYTNDIPKLDELKFSSSEKYTYAYAINQDKSLTPQKFGEQFDKLDMDNNGSMKQDEMINYFNKYKTSESQAQYLWNTYGENKGKAWAAKPVYKDGKWKKSK